MKSIIAIALLAASTSAFAASSDEVRSADQRVQQQQKALAIARRSGDPVTIATERAALQAATATAWSRRNPGPVPKSRKR